MQLFEVRLNGVCVPKEHLAKLSEDAGRPLAYQTNQETGEPFSWLEYATPSVLLTSEQLAYWAPRISPTVDSVRTIREPRDPAEDVAAYSGERRVGPELNTKVQVAVSGLGLLQIDEVQLETDCCTDYLSKCLADGWRILAVCVQPDQRRPDYILGRVSKP